MMSGAICAAAALQSVLVLGGAPGWPCPLAKGLGIPCPGCGLSRAIAALLRGDWQASFASHALAPVILIALVLLAFATLLPEGPSSALAARVEAFERRTGLAAIFSISLLGYWLVRLLFFPEAFIRLAQG
jgi:hypothetical protein